MMNIGKLAIELIKKYEGFSASPYLCPAKIPTIGYGNTYYEDGRKVKMSDPPISAARAESLLQMVLQRYEAAVNRYVQVPLNQAQFDALVSFAYNVGNEALRTSTLLQRLNKGDYTGAANQFLRWNRAGGRVLAGLSRRRNDERSLFLS